MARVITFEAEVEERTVCKFSLAVPDDVEDVEGYVRARHDRASNDAELEYVTAAIDGDTITNIRLEADSG